MKKNYVISPQIINTIEMSNEPWGIQDSSSNFIHDDSATKNLFVLLIMKSSIIMNYPRLLSSCELK
ncbi:hypothetical protein CE143_10235 [Photorhabdus luminescens]|uniref:Transposase n=1 Tax=Photorhabdus akhurstii TaxID=171438 RepID=A0ABX8LSH4_9GAMM|nr:hypothetical protein B0X70_10325 [Photorhabdus akhurstii]UJD75291.1 hypothetical protein CE143_10235 [Photorhabdus luminescens]